MKLAAESTVAKPFLRNKKFHVGRVAGEGRVSYSPKENAFDSTYASAAVRRQKMLTLQSIQADILQMQKPSWDPSTSAPSHIPNEPIALLKCFRHNRRDRTDLINLATKKQRACYGGKDAPQPPVPSKATSAASHRHSDSWRAHAIGEVQYNCTLSTSTPTPSSLLCRNSPKKSIPPHFTKATHSGAATNTTTTSTATTTSTTTTNTTAIDTSGWNSSTQLCQRDRVLKEKVGRNFILSEPKKTKRRHSRSPEPRRLHISLRQRVANITRRNREFAKREAAALQSFREEILAETPMTSAEAVEAKALRRYRASTQRKDVRDTLRLRRSLYQPATNLTRRNRRYQEFFHPGVWDEVHKTATSGSESSDSEGPSAAEDCGSWSPDEATTQCAQRRPWGSRGQVNRVNKEKERKRLVGWSCCGSFEKQSRGCRAVIKNPDAWCVAGL